MRFVGQVYETKTGEARHASKATRQGSASLQFITPEAKVDQRQEAHHTSDQKPRWDPAATHHNIACGDPILDEQRAYQLLQLNQCALLWHNQCR